MLLLRQDFAYSYRVWITLIKLLYAPLRHRRSGPNIQPTEYLCGGLLPSVRRVSENNSSRDCLESAQRVFRWPTLCTMESKRYSTDLSDDEWRCIGPHLPGPKGHGRPRLHGLRAILDAVFYVLKSGCPWRLLPREFPPWKT